MSMGTVSLGSYTESSGGDRLYPVTIQIQNTFGGYTPVKALSDTGNEISIFKREVADSLGLDLNQGELFHVAGINGAGREFRRFRLNVKIGNLQPVKITIGFAVKQGDLVENLLGNADLLKSGKFEVVYNEKGVTYKQKALMGRVACGDLYMNEQEVMNNLYDHLTTRRRVNKDKCGCDDQFRHDKKPGGHNSIGGYGVFY